MEDDLKLVLTLLSGTRAGESVTVDHVPFRVGRSPENDLALTDFDHVSSTHGEIRTGPDGRPMYVDLGSTNGSALRRAGGESFVDLRGYRRRVESLSEGDELHLGDPAAPLRVALTFEGAVAQTPAALEDPAGQTLSTAFDAVDPINATLRQAPPEVDSSGRIPPLITAGGDLLPLDEAILALERAQVREALIRGEGGRVEAAKLLGIDLDRLLDLMERLGIA